MRIDMKKENKDAIQILHDRYITNEKRKASLENERINAKVARKDKKEKNRRI